MLMRSLGYERRAFIEKWNEILVHAAEDLAVFTQFGINATFISTLALKCEEFEKAKQSSSQPEEILLLKEEILEGLITICKTGQKIWEHIPNKKTKYEMVEEPIGLISIRSVT